MPFIRACERCEATFGAKRRDARFCSPRCQKAARRRAAPRSPMSRAEALEELAAMLEFLPADMDLLESRFPEGEDDVDEVLAGMEVTWRSLERIHAWLTSVPPAIVG
ncbi:hypothetical protein [Nocardioides sp. HB32]